MLTALVIVDFGGRACERWLLQMLASRTVARLGTVRRAGA